MFSKRYEIVTHESGKYGHNFYRLVLIRKIFGLELKYESIPLGILGSFRYGSTHKSDVELMIKKLEAKDENWVRMKLR